MRLLSYKLTVPASVITVDKYFHIKFRAAFAKRGSGDIIDTSGKIIQEAIKKTNLHSLKNILEEVSRENKGVTWHVEIQQRGTVYKFQAKDGEVEYKRVRPIINDPM